MIGAPFLDGGGGADYGAAFLYLGSAGGLSPFAFWGMISDQPGARLGSSVATAGDVNGDGYSDFVIGTPGHDGSFSEEGLVSVHLGSPDLLSTSAAWSVTGGSPSAFLGLSVASAGDVNGDGFADVIVGRPGAIGGMDEGSALTYLGNSGNGVTRLPRQERTAGAVPIVLLGRSDAPDGFLVEVDGSGPGGRSLVRLELEVKPAGIPFDGSGTMITPPADTGVAGVTLSQLVSGLEEDAPYRWRARILGDSPLFPRSRWMSVAGNGLTEYDLRTGSTATAIRETAVAGPPVAFALPRPNPSAGDAELQFRLPAPGTVQLAIYNLAGRRVALVADGRYPAGAHALRWDGTNSAGRRVAAGTYFARLEFEGRTETHKIVRAY
jgi:hypothetical protein